MNESKVMNAKLRNQLSKIKQTRTTPKLFAFTKILALSVLLLSVLIVKFNAVNSAAIAIVSDDKENANEFVSIVENNIEKNDAESAQMMATASTLKLQKQHQNKAQNDDGPAAFQWQKLVGNSKFRYAQKWSLTEFNLKKFRANNERIDFMPQFYIDSLNNADDRVRRYNCFFTPLNCDNQHNLAQRRRSELNDLINLTTATATHRRNNNRRGASKSKQRRRYYGSTSTNS